MKILCYSPTYRMKVGHWGNDDESIVQKSAEDNPHLIYYFI